MKRSSRIVFPALLALSVILAPVFVRTQAGRGGAGDRERFEGRDVAAGEVLVRFRADAALGREGARRDVDADDDQPVGQTGWRRMHSASRSVQAMMLALARRADVLDVEPNYIVHTTLVPNDPFFPSLWGLKNNSVAGADIHATAAWNLSTGSTANVVGIVDTGVDYTHPDLAANMWSAPAQFTVTVAGRAITCPAGSHGFNAIAFFQNQPNAVVCNPADDYFHGTHVAGTVGASGNNGAGVAGVNWTTRIMGLKFLDSTGSGSLGDAINSIDFAIQVKNYFAASKGANVRVLSNSYGGDGLSQTFSAAIARANTADMLFVAAAGNAGANNDATPFYPASDPGANVVAVAATDENDGRAGFSNYGATSVDLGAPGNNVLSTLPGGGYGGASGTSMATPHVAGAAALVLSGCSLTTAQLRAALLGTVDAVPALAGITVTGGRLNVDRALRSCATLPTVALDSPSEGASYFAPASIALAVSASDPDGIARVEYYNGSTLVGTATTSPFSGSWANVPIGSYTLTAKAFDTLGLSTMSAPVHVTVVNAPPTVVLTSPAPGTSYVAGSSIALAATASDSDGIKRVEFYAGATLVGTSTTSPYTAMWASTPAGTYTLTAKAYDTLDAATVSAPVNVTVTAASVPTSATFVGTDAATQGSWRGTYGTDGYVIVNDTSSQPAYATLTPSGQESWTWASSTNDVRALQKASGSSRLAATWYGGTFTLDVNVTDGGAHPLALYLVDWDSRSRVLTLEVRNAATSALLDSRTVSSFNGGQYWRWTVSGHVTVKVTSLAGPNAVLSGAFFGGAPSGNVAPTVALTSPEEGASYTAPASLALSAQASDADGIARVEFYQGATLIGTAATSPYQVTLTSVPAGNYTLTAKAYDSLGLAAVSAPVHMTVTPAGGGLPTGATFLGTDATTQGSWRGVYGADGYQVVNDAVSYPAYASVTPSGQGNWTWAASSSDARALQKAVGPDRLAATWYGGTFTLDVNVVDGGTHQLALYVVDWDSTNRSQLFEIRDGATGALLDSRSVTNFHDGQYWRWIVSGHVVVRVSVTSGVNAVVSGVFLGGAGVSNPPPTVALTSPTTGATYTAPASIALAATASDSDGIKRVEFYAGATLVGSSTTSPYQATWSGVPAGTYTLTAKAYDNLDAVAVSAPVDVTVAAAGGGVPTGATFIGTDTTTQGNWRGAYGLDGYQVVGDAVSPPPYATLTASGQDAWTWVGSTSEVRALQKATGSDRLAATWYGGSFSIDVNVTDGGTHQLALYVLDWDARGRIETLEVRDAVTNALLDTRIASGFQGGQYWRWTVSGHVVVRVTVNAGVNAVVSGVFVR